MIRDLCSTRNNRRENYKESALIVEGTETDTEHPLWPHVMDSTLVSPRPNKAGVDGPEPLFLFLSFRGSLFVVL